MATMRQARHEMLKAKWIEIIREHSKSGMAVRAWCEVNQISSASFFYWSRVIRQDSLVKAGTMAVTGQAQFAEITSDVKGVPSKRTEICAVIRSHGNEIEIYNGADSTTLESILRLIGRP